MGSGSLSKIDNALPPGTMVGEFRIGEKLGEGGMGVVYGGQHPVIGKRVAVKVLSSECASNPDLVRRFLEEARAVNRIGHPNIIDIFSFGQLTDGRQYFVMEFLQGESLAARLEKGDIEQGELRRLLRQICGALEAAHRVGIIHRDLKPENIWVATPNQEDAYAKLLDFGIAKLVDLDTAKITQTGAAMGSPQFMPPEQFMGLSIDRRADIYAMGVILYRIFTGSLPFQGKSIPELVYQQTTQAPVPPSHHRSIDPDIERIILDCLEKEPTRRPGTARELGERLERAFTEEKARPAVIAGGTQLMAATTSIETTLPWVADAEGASPRIVENVVGDERPVSEPVLSREPRAFRARVLLVGGSVLIVSVAAFILFRGRSSDDRAPGGGRVATLVDKANELPPAERQALPTAPLEPEVKPFLAPPKVDVAIHIRSVPPGARIVSTADGAVLGKTPLEITRPRGSNTLPIRLDLRGWKGINAEVPLGADFDHSYTLDKIVLPIRKHAIPAPLVQRPRSDPFEESEPERKQTVPTPSLRAAPGISPSPPVLPPAPSAPEPPKKRPLRI